MVTKKSFKYNFKIDSYLLKKVVVNCLRDTNWMINWLLEYLFICDYAKEAPQGNWATLLKPSRTFDSLSSKLFPRIEKSIFLLLSTDHILFAWPQPEPLIGPLGIWFYTFLAFSSSKGERSEWHSYLKTCIWTSFQKLSPLYVKHSRLDIDKWITILILLRY